MFTDEFIFELQRFHEADIVGTENSDSITVNKSSQYVQALGGRDYIVINEANYGSQKNNVTIDAGDGNDTIKTAGYYSNSDHYPTENSSINAGAGNDSIYNVGNSNTLEGGDGADSISNTAQRNVSISGGAGKDSITSISDNTMIEGGADDDTITTSGTYSVIISGGAGNDSISNTNSNADVLYKYNSGDGNDTITDYSPNIDTVMILSPVTVGNPNATSSGDVTFKVGKGQITFQNSANKYIELVDTVGNVLKKYNPR